MCAGRSGRGAIQSAMSARLDDLEHGALPLARGRDLQESPYRVGDSALLADDLAHVVLRDLQLEDDRGLTLDLVHLDLLGVVDERARDVLDELLHWGLLARDYRECTGTAIALEPAATGFRRS